MLSSNLNVEYSGRYYSKEYIEELDAESTWCA